MKEFASEEWNRALRTLNSGFTLIEIDPDSAASRAYYAAFHALTALFALKDKTFTKHTAIRAALHHDLINTGEWEEERGKDYDYLLELRETGDYGGIIHVSTEDAIDALKKAEHIIKAVNKISSELTYIERKY